MTYDYYAHSAARKAQTTADTAHNGVRDLAHDFRAALTRIEALEEQVRLLKEELAPKTLDKPTLPPTPYKPGE